MTKHPLTNKKLFKKFWHHTVDVTTEVLYTPDGMRSAYDRGRDEQLEQVMEWLDEHLTNYSDADYLGSCESINDLEEHLAQAMRPKKKGKR